MTNPVGNPHNFTTQTPTQQLDGGAQRPLLFSLPPELLVAITERVATAATPQQAAKNAITWGRVSVLPHQITHEPCIASVISHGKRQKDLDEALMILWDAIPWDDLPAGNGIPGSFGRAQAGVPRIASAIREWLADPNNTPVLDALRFLDCERRRLKVIPPEICAFRNLQTLHLAGNQITQIDPEAFADCPALETLNLHNNQITQLAPQTFAGCSRLHTLLLSNNQITQIASRAFTGCLRLQQLHLENNQITQIAPETFAGCPALRQMHLENNRIMQIGPQAFEGCFSLNTLYLRNNQITQIYPEAFTGCPALNSLYFEENQITQIASQAFADCPALGYLGLSDNDALLLCVSVYDDRVNFFEKFNAFSRYTCRSAFAAFYKALSEGSLTRPEIVEHLKQLQERNLIYERVYWEAVAAAEKERRVFSTDGDHQWGENHVCDDMPTFCRALKSTVCEKYNRLSPEQKRVVHCGIYAIARADAGLGPDARAWDDPNDWGERHREKSVLRFIDAMAEVRTP